MDIGAARGRQVRCCDSGKDVEGAEARLVDSGVIASWGPGLDGELQGCRREDKVSFEVILDRKLRDCLGSGLGFGCDDVDADRTC